MQRRARHGGGLSSFRSGASRLWSGPSALWSGASRLWSGPSALSSGGFAACGAAASPPVDRVPSVLDHVSVNVSDVARSRAFYEAALAPLGYRAMLEPVPGIVGFF